MYRLSPIATGPRPLPWPARCWTSLCQGLRIKSPTRPLTSRYTVEPQKSCTIEVRSTGLFIIQPAPLAVYHLNSLLHGAIYHLNLAPLGLFSFWLRLWPISLVAFAPLHHLLSWLLSWAISHVDCALLGHFFILIAVMVYFSCRRLHWAVSHLAVALLGYFSFQPVVCWAISDFAGGERWSRACLMNVLGLRSIPIHWALPSPPHTHTSST